MTHSSQDFDQWLVQVIGTWASHEQQHIEEGNDPTHCMTPPMFWIRGELGRHSSKGHMRAALDREIPHKSPVDRGWVIDSDEYTAVINWIRDNWNGDLT